MSELLKIRISIISLIFLLMTLVLPHNALSEISYQKMNHIITLNDSRLNVKSITEISIKGSPINSVSFTFPKTWQIANFKAYENNSSNLLTTTIEENYSSSSIRVTVNFPTKSENETYKLVSEFSSSYRKDIDRIKYFYWSWGNASHPLELSYTIKIPSFVEIVYTNSTYNRILEKDYTIIGTNGIAEPNEYFEFWFYYRNLNPPELKLIKYPTSTEITEGETFIVTIEVVNIGELVAKNVSITNKISGVFKPEGETSWNTDIQPSESKQFKYVLRGISASKNELSEESIAVYTDESGENWYESRSNQFNITINRLPYVIDFFGIKIPLKLENPLPLIYNFFIGYLVLFTIYIVRRRDVTTWNSISSLDKIIYSTFCSIINFIISFYVIGVVLFIVSLPLVYIFEIHNIDPEFLFYYLFPLMSVVITSTLLDKLTNRLGRRRVNIVDSILMYFFRNKKRLIILYIGIILLALIKYFTFS